MNTIHAYHDTPSLKESLLDSLRVLEQHGGRMDPTVFGWHRTEPWTFRGGLIDWILNGSEPTNLETFWGIPLLVARLQERIFRRLPDAEAASFPGQFLVAIQVGADLSAVWPQQAVWMLTDDPQFAAIRYVTTTEQRQAIERVAELFRSGSDDEEEWRKAWLAAKERADYLMVNGETWADELSRNALRAAQHAASFGFVPDDDRAAAATCALDATRAEPQPNDRGVRACLGAESFAAHFLDLLRAQH